MTQKNAFLYSILTKGSRALAGYAANDLLDKEPQAREGFEPDPFSAWQTWLAGRLDELAAAAAVDRPGLFASQVQWAKTALAARGIETEYFRKGLESLRGVLQKELPGTATPVTEQYLARALAAFDRAPSESASLLSPDTEFGRLAARYLVTILEGDRRRATELMVQAAQSGHAVPDLFAHVLAPAQQEIGRMWLADEVTVAEEHFATSTTRRAMAQLANFAKFQPANGKKVLTAAVAGNQHDLGLQIVADFFEFDGWQVFYLGADMPSRGLAKAIEVFQPDLLGLSVSLSTHLHTAADAIAAVRATEPGKSLKILIGGQALSVTPDLFKELGADAYASSAAEAVAVGRSLVGLQ